MSIAIDSAAEGARCLLVGVQLPGVSEAELSSSLDELERLTQTLGLKPVGRLTQRRASTGSAAVLGTGKLRELAQWTGGPGVVPAGASKRQTGSRPAEEPAPEEEADGEDDAMTPVVEQEHASVVVFDHDLTPSQLRNLEGATAAEVLDRSSVILGIFQRHASTREARLQVEIARLSYLAPRLRATGAGEDRQRGGIGGKGAGESSLELDRRRVRDRIAELKEELVQVQQESTTRRSRRTRYDTVALVGYTNAGKSSLMRALTASEVLVADRLFATLDTTVRALEPPTRPRILVSDTVGFIKKLPHDLVASFRSTLEEARDAALLVHVIDASDAAWRSHLEVTQKVLRELDAGDAPALFVFNKADRLDEEARAAILAEMPEALVLSALRPADIARLHARIVSIFERDMIEDEIFVSYREPRGVHDIHEACQVVGEIYEEEGTRIKVKAPRALLDKLRAALASANSAQV